MGLVASCSCFTGNAVIIPFVRVLDITEAKNKYITEGIVGNEPSDDALECRTLLDDPICIKYFSYISGISPLIEC